MELPKLKGKNRYETAENYSILLIVVGAVMLSAGIGLTVITPKGIPAVLAMMGALVSFLATTLLIFIWLAKEMFGPNEGEHG